MATKEVLEQLALLRDKTASARDHLAQLLVHNMLILTPRHPIELTQLFNEFVHCKHRRCQGLALFIDVFGALNHLVV